MPRKISVSFDEDQIRKMVSNMLIPDILSRNDLVEYFTAMIMENYGAGEPFVLLMTGSQSDQRYYNNDLVQVSLESMYIGNIEKEKTMQLGYSEGGWIWAKIIDYKKHRTDCYNVSFNYIGPSGEEQRGTYWLPSSAIRKDKVIPDKDRMNFGDLL